MTVVRGDGRALRRWLGRMLELSELQAAQLHQKVHIQIGDGVILNTPVGNPSLWKNPPPPNYVGGRARGGWQSAIGSPAGGEVERVDPNGGATQAATQSTALRIRVGDTSYISNNVPYIRRLNDGWSTQAPARFVESTIDRVAEQFRR